MPELQGVAQRIIEDRYLWPTEKQWSDLCHRVARECAKNEVRSDYWEEEFFNMIYNLMGIPAGRILRNLGKAKPSTSNCNVLPIGDSIEEIFKAIEEYGIISSYGGGTGMDFSPLRPINAALKTKGGKSSGLVSFLEIFNFAGKRIMTGGQRRSAGIAICRVNHPEIFGFIDAKTIEGKLDQFNISVSITKEFLKAVEEDGNVELKFAGKVYDSVKAKIIWNLILNNMINHAEPGLINWDNMIKTNTYYFSPICAVNPCGELPLEAYGVCNLLALSLPKFIVNKNINKQLFSKTIRTAVRFLDNIIDLAYYPIKKQEIVVKNSRRIGLGTMGLADYFFMKNIRYGSEEAVFEAEKIYKFIRDEAYLASIDLSKEKGAFPMYNKIDYTSASFIKKLPAKIRMAIKENSIRNSTLLSAQPTGTTSILAGVVNGIEPLPYKGYIRNDGIGKTMYIHPLCKDSYKEPWFVDTYDLTPEDHLEMQTIIQRYIDGGISKTIILPKDTTSEKLGKLLLEYIYDLKGVTVYRDGCREQEVYTRMTEKEIMQNLKKEHTTEFDEGVVNCIGSKCEL